LLSTAPQTQTIIVGFFITCYTPRMEHGCERERNTLRTPTHKLGTVHPWTPTVLLTLDTLHL